MVMKNLKDSILDKLKVDDIVINVNEYPIDDSYEEQLNFLKKHKFKIITMPKSAIYMRQLVDFLNYEKDKICCINDLSDYGAIPVIRIVDTSKHEISKDNPMFMIYKDKGKMNYIIVYESYLVKHVMEDKWLHDLETYFKF